MPNKRVTLRVQVTVPDNNERRIIEKVIVDAINRIYKNYDSYARVTQEDPLS